MFQCSHPQTYGSPCPARSPWAMASAPTSCAGSGVERGVRRVAGRGGLRRGRARASRPRRGARGSRRPRGGKAGEDAGTEPRGRRSGAEGRGGLSGERAPRSCLSAAPGERGPDSASRTPPQVSAAAAAAVAAAIFPEREAVTLSGRRGPSRRSSLRSGAAAEGA